MPRRARVLYALQSCDIQLALKKRRYREVEAGLGDRSTLEEARAGLEESKSNLAHWRGALRDLELQVAGVAEKLKADTARLYSGEVSNPRALSDLQHETEYLKRRKADLEDKQLEAMIAVEEATSQAAVANEAYIVADAAWKANNADLSQEYELLRQELSQLLAQRQSLLKHITADDMAEYSSIRRLRQGIAVVAVQNGMCRVCNVQVPQRDLEQAQQTDEIYYCSGCERILYVPQDDEG